MERSHTLHSASVNNGHSQPPQQLPDPWLFDSEALLRELDRCRELILQIPITNPNATDFGIQIAVAAIWNLSCNLRDLLQLHRRDNVLSVNGTTPNSRAHFPSPTPTTTIANLEHGEAMHVTRSAEKRVARVWTGIDGILFPRQRVLPCYAARPTFR
jgi:hypothetical protein